MASHPNLQELILQLQSPEGGVLMIHKPLRWTSFDVVRKIRGALKIRKIGHAGTLDPLATGLLILCTGKQTKRITDYQNLEKQYVGEMVIGKTTPSIDLETPFDSETAYQHIDPASLPEIAQQWTGTLWQLPPVYSAVHIQGKRAYLHARKGDQVEVPPREVHVRHFLLSQIQLPVIHFDIACSKGTYIRSMVRDFGAHLQVGAYLQSLCRTRIGAHTLEMAHHIEDLVS